MILAATQSKSSGTSFLPILIIGALFLLVYTTMSRRSRARRAQQAQGSIVPGTRVRTSSGIYGTVTSVEGNDDVMLEVAPGVHIRVMQRAVVPLPPDASMGGEVPQEPEDEPEDADDDAEDAQDEAEHDTVNHASTNGSVHASADADSATVADGEADAGDTHVGDRDPQDRNV
jgi:preprotein translocase subunit YajC